MAGRWEREYFQPENGDAFLHYIVFGDIDPEREIPAKEYRTSGPPQGTELEFFVAKDQPEWMEGWTTGYFGALLEEQPELNVKDAKGFAMLHGEVEDPETLDYLRDTVGVVTALLDAGGTAVLDAVALRWWSPEEWRATIFEPAGPEPIEHITLLASAEIGGFWIHSQGMRKFGRPDLSARGLAEDDLDLFAGLFESLTVTLASGAVIPDGQRIRIGGTKVFRSVSLVEEDEEGDFDNARYELK